MSQIRGLSRRRYFSSAEPLWLFVFCLGLPAASLGQDFCAPQSDETGEPATVRTKTTDGAVGVSGVFGSGVTDITFKHEDGAIPVMAAVMAADPFDVEGFSRFNPELDQKDPILAPDTVRPLFGVAHIPSGAFAGDNLVLDPGFTATDLTTPEIAVLGTDGVIRADFLPVTGALDPAAVLMAIDVHPEEGESVVLDTLFSQFYFLNSDFEVTRGPFDALGFPSLSYPTGRGGICYNSCDTVLIVSAFRNLATSFMALEYDRLTGEYTGRAISLRDTASLGGGVIAIGLDVGFLNGEEVLYTYNAVTDSLYTTALEYTSVPGSVANLACLRGPDLSITWDLDPAFDYDSIVISQNGVDIASLPPDQSSFVPPPSVAMGYSEFSVELRKDDQPNDIQAYCTDVSNPIGLFSSALVFLDSGNFFGLDCTPQVASLQDFRLYSIASITDDILVFDFDLNLLETIAPEITGEVVGMTGVALTEVAGEPMLAVLGGNADGAAAASIHRFDGSLFQTVSPIDVSVLSAGTAEPVFVDWDTDSEGRLVSVDIANNRLVLFEYDSDVGIMIAVDEAPIPQCAINPCDGSGAGVPLPGSVSVLPNGLYLVSSGDSFDSTITRALVATPFSEDPATSVKFTGYTQGLRLYNHLIFGAPPPLLSVGPGFSFGLATSHLEYTDEEGTPVVEEVSFYTLPGPPQLQFSVLFHATEASTNPAYDAIQLTDSLFQGDAETGNLRPPFANQASAVDFSYYVVNRGDEPIVLQVEVLLDSLLSDELTERLALPPGRNVYRNLVGRSEKEINVRVALIDGGPEATYQILVGSRAITGEVVAPQFLRGDDDGDGTLGIGDAIFNLNFQFIGAVTPLCVDAMDFDDNGAIELADPISSLGHQFLGQPPPPAPGKDNCGPDPTADDFDCEDYPQERCN